MKDRMDSKRPDPLEEAARTLLRAEPEGTPVPDAVFLAGFRRKLEEGRDGVASSVAVGELCWRLVPALGAAAAVLALSSWLLVRAEPSVSAVGDQVLLSLYTHGPSEGVEDDLILSAALLEETDR
jgi:hypothetical protein